MSYSRRQFVSTGLGGALSGLCISELSADESAPQSASNVSSLPKVLLLGDSISLGYTDFVIGILLDEVDVVRPLNDAGFYLNCEGTTKARRDLTTWLGDEKWDAIHFNFGLHDLKHVDPTTGRNSRKPTDPLQASPEQYAKNLDWIVQQLKATKAKLIFATTTPYREDPGGPLRDAGLSEEYNEIAVPIMHRNGIEINDLYGYILPRMKEFMPAKNVHMRPAGSLQLAKRVVAHIREGLAAYNGTRP